MKTFKQYILFEGQLEDYFVKRGAEKQDAKDAIARWRKLNPKQKEKVPNPQKYQDLKSFISDLESAEDVVSKTAKEKKVKQSGISGLLKGKEYLEFNTGDSKFQAYAPLRWEASKHIASKRIGSCEGQWCTAYQKSPDYWDEYIFEKAGALIYVITPDSKYAIYYRRSKPVGLPGWSSSPLYYKIFDANDNEKSTPEIEKLAEKLMSNFNKIRDSYDHGPKGIMKQLGINHYTIKSNNVVDVDQDVRLDNKNLSEIPVQFGVVDGHFFIAGNNLTSLKGAPKRVGGHFDCSDNNLKSLQGGPEYVGWDMRCGNNKLRDLQHAPKKVGKDFWCQNNDLTSLKGAPEYVGEYFMCNSNPKLKSLKGAPKYIGENLVCSDTQIKNAKEEVKKLRITVKGSVIN